AQVDPGFRAMQVGPRRGLADSQRDQYSNQANWDFMAHDCPRFPQPRGPSPPTRPLLFFAVVGNASFRDVLFRGKNTDAPPPLRALYGMGGTAMNRLVPHLRRAALMGLTDRELLEALVTHRDETAFEVLLRRHGSMVLAVCQRVLRNAHDAEDAFQA